MSKPKKRLYIISAIVALISVLGVSSMALTNRRVFAESNKTEFSESVALNRYGLNVDETQEDFSNEIFGEEGKFTLIYNYVTPPSYYTQGYPVSEDGMCLFASSDGNGGYIELSINEIDGKEVNINSITLSFSKLTKASPTVLVNGDEVVGQIVTLENSDLYGYTYEVNSNKVIIQNQYNGTIDYWSLLALYDLTINYTIK